MSPLTIAETLQFRALKRTGAVLMLLLRLDRPTGETEIAALLDIAPKTARSHLQSLSAIGLVTRSNFHKGWMLTGMGQQLVLPMAAVEVEEEPLDAVSEEPLDAVSEEPLDAVSEEPLDVVSGEHLDVVSGKPIEAEVVKTHGDGAEEFTAEETDQAQNDHSWVNPVKVTGLPIININNNRIKESFKDNNNKQALKMTGLTPGKAVRDPPVRTTTSESPTPEELATIRALKKRGIMLNRRTSQLIGRITEEDIESAWTTLSWQGKEFESGLLVYMLEQMAISQDLARPKYDRNGQIVNNFRVLEDNTITRDYAQSADWVNNRSPTEPDREPPPAVLSAWERAQHMIRAQFTPAEYDTWVKEIVPSGTQDGCLVFTLVNHYARDWLEARRELFETYLGMDVRFETQGHALSAGMEAEYG